MQFPSTYLFPINIIVSFWPHHIIASNSIPVGAACIMLSCNSLAEPHEAEFGELVAELLLHVYAMIHP